MTLPQEVSLVLIGDAMQTPDAHVRINSLAHIQGLDDFPLIPVSTDERNAIAAVVQNYIALLRRLEQQLDRDASQRAELWLRRLNVPRLPNGQIDPSFCSEFRVYGDWILKELRAFGSSLGTVAEGAVDGSPAIKLMHGLTIHCEECISTIEARVAEIREGNAHELNRDDMSNEGDVIKNGLASWRLPATTLITVLIELGDLKLKGEDEKVIWHGLSGSDGDRILGDVVLLSVPGE